MPVLDHHKAGLRDLLQTEKNTPILLQLSKSTTKHVFKTEDPSEALDVLVTQIGDTYKLLSKRSISKEILFTYLSTKDPGVTTDFTKADLITKVISYWDQCVVATIPQNTNGTVSISENKKEEDYPIHTIARKFGEWFFEIFNKDNLQLVDLWSDATLNMTIIASDGVNELECSTAAEVIEALSSAKQQFGFHFNPNLTHNGIQGRMDAYGHVVVLSCGTLHTQDTCVGVFECAFGLVRDPHLDNNWKPRHFKFLLKSAQQPPELHSLGSSETLQAALELPVPSEDLE
ncbi:uncharacterized protein Dana_GF23870 [Drosophila ananassae]|uniref:NTF2 domain-containing protein n=1 Tax=Drosophila ananassae TaxID=7217 RepID=B3M4Y2_DROAN|nr:uncharacterized protein C3orf38 [Drosophila ananassae]EDV40556.1 uncharacterized protein Dana_GF23870 [Drosophila ananassae]